MNAVGIDVSNGKSMVTILRPFGEIVSSPFEIKRTSSDILSLIKLIHSIEGESRIVMEHTGHYYEVLAQQFSAAGLFVSAVNPKLVKNFNNDSLRKVKSDKTDSIKPPDMLLTNGKILNHVPAPIRTIHIISIKQSKMQDFRFFNNLQNFNNICYFSIFSSHR